MAVLRFVWTHNCMCVSLFMASLTSSFRHYYRNSEHGAALVFLFFFTLMLLFPTTVSEFIDHFIYDH